MRLGFDWRALIAAELVRTPDGLGQMIFAAAGYHRSDIIIAGLIIGLIAIAMDRWLLRPIERRTIQRWGPVIDATRKRAMTPRFRAEGLKFLTGIVLLGVVL